MVWPDAGNFIWRNRLFVFAQVDTRVNDMNSVGRDFLFLAADLAAVAVAVVVALVLLGWWYLSTGSIVPLAIATVLSLLLGFNYLILVAIGFYLLSALPRLRFRLSPG